MTRSFRNIHMGCGETLSCSNWLLPVRKQLPVNIKGHAEKLMLKGKQKRKL